MTTSASNEIAAMTAQLREAHLRLAAMKDKAAARLDELTPLSTAQLVEVVNSGAGYMPITAERFTRAAILDSIVSRQYPVERVERFVGDLADELHVLSGRAGY